VIRCDRKAKLWTVKIIEETKKMEVAGCGRSLLCELRELCVSFLENLRYSLVATNGRAVTTAICPAAGSI
jgi:hypothetical protein